MVALDWTTTREGGVTFVTCVLDAGDTTRRVRLRNELAGPLWPPRRQGVPEAGWTADGFDGVVGPGMCALGYATPAPPADPPVSLVASERADRDERTGDSATAIVRELGDPTPPREALPGMAPDDPEPTDAAAVPPAIESWLAEVRERIERAENGADTASTTEHAHRESTLRRDERALDAVGERTESLSTRLTAISKR